MKLAQDGHLDDAVAAFRKALAADPTFFMAAYNQGVILARQGKKQEAVEAFREVIKLRPDFVMGHYGLALILKSMGDPEAEEELRKAHLLNQYVAQPLGRSGTDGAVKPTERNSQPAPAP
jgi:tetratricopeptide (TPR) repeat protein